MSRRYSNAPNAHSEDVIMCNTEATTRGDGGEGGTGVGHSPVDLIRADDFDHIAFVQTVILTDAPLRTGVDGV